MGRFDPFAKPSGNARSSRILASASRRVKGQNPPKPEVQTGPLPGRRLIAAGMGPRNATIGLSSYLSLVQARCRGRIVLVAAPGWMVKMNYEIAII
jgi:hypothetical protein